MGDNLMDWCGPKSILFLGSRGCGKTSILKAMSWELIYGQSGMVIQGTNRVLNYLKQPKHIGVYYRSEEMDSELWKRWGLKDDDKAEYFATYLEYVVIDLFLDALNKLSASSTTGALFAPPTKEAGFIADFTAICYPSGSGKPVLRDNTFTELRAYISQYHRDVKHAVNMNLTSIQTLASVLPRKVVLGEHTKKMVQCVRDHYPSLINTVL